METCHIFLSGGMQNLSFEEQTRWRFNFKNAILYGEKDLDKKPIFFDPVEYFNFEEKRYKTEKEVVEFDLCNLRNSDLVVVNFNDPKSLGAMAELAIAHELKIPIIALNKDNKVLHPWMEYFCNRICSDMRELVEYVCDFYLN